MLAGLIGCVPGSSMDSRGVFPLSSMNFWSGHKWGPSDRACSLGSPLSSESPIDHLLCCSAALSSAECLHLLKDHTPSSLRTRSAHPWCCSQAMPGFAPFSDQPCLLSSSQVCIYASLSLSLPRYSFPLVYLSIATKLDGPFGWWLWSFLTSEKPVTYFQKWFIASLSEELLFPKMQIRAMRDLKKCLGR